VCPSDFKHETLRLAKYLFAVEQYFQVAAPKMTTSTSTELLIATGNKGKIIEYQKLLAPLGLSLRNLADFPKIEDVEETGATFSDNAVLKARSYARQTGLWTLADDSGLEVDALGGAPGVFSARYGGEGATDGARIERLLGELSQFSGRERRARFICVIAIADTLGQIANISTGKCEGMIAHAPRGDKGFGYDPVFIPDGFQQTFGELPSEIKQDISHRARAVKEAQSFLLSHFQSPA
jgi:XTP/dITP diphosphohydrolase